MQLLKLNALFPILSLAIADSTLVNPGFVCEFKIKTSLVPGQVASSSRFDNLFVVGAQYEASTLSVTLTSDYYTGWDFCYNGTHIGNGPITASPDVAFGAGLSMESPDGITSSWGKVLSRDPRLAPPFTVTRNGFWSVVPGEMVTWTEINTNSFGVHFGGFLACDWSLPQPQIFWHVPNLKAVTPNCARVDLIPVIGSHTRIGDRPPYNGW